MCPLPVPLPEAQRCMRGGLEKVQRCVGIAADDWNMGARLPWPLLLCPCCFLTEQYAIVSGAAHITYVHV